MIDFFHLNLIKLMVNFIFCIIWLLISPLGFRYISKIFPTG